MFGLHVSNECNMHVRLCSEGTDEFLLISLGRLHTTDSTLVEPPEKNALICTYNTMRELCSCIN